MPSLTTAVVDAFVFTPLFVMLGACIAKVVVLLSGRTDRPRVNAAIVVAMGVMFGIITICAVIVIYDAAWTDYRRSLP